MNYDMVDKKYFEDENINIIRNSKMKVSTNNSNKQSMNSNNINDNHSEHYLNIQHVNRDKGN